MIKYILYNEKNEDEKMQLCKNGFPADEKYINTFIKYINIRINQLIHMTRYSNEMYV